jgi:tetratricopeptide (TPR) repeat protein
LAEIDEAEGRRAEAALQYRKAQSLGAALPDGALLLLAEMDAEARVTEPEAIKGYLNYLRLRPLGRQAASSVQAALEYACQVTEETRSAERKAAITTLGQVVAIRPDWEWAQYSLGLANLLDGRAAEALPLFQSANRLDPKRKLTYYWLCICHLQLSPPRLQEAIAALEFLLKNPLAEARHRRREGKACLEIGKQLIQALGGLKAKRDWAEPEVRTNLLLAIRYLDLAVERMPDDASLRGWLASSLELAGHPERALVELAKAAELAPEYAHRLGAVLHRNGNWLAAADALRKAVALDPNSREATALLADSLVRAGDFTGAQTVAMAGMQGRASSSKLMMLLVRALFAQGKHAEVVREVGLSESRKAEAARDSETAFLVARSMALSGAFDDAVLWLASLEPEIRVRYYLGCAHAHCGSMEAARVCFDEVAGSDSPYRIRAIVQRAHLSFSLGHLDEAERDYRNVIENHGGGAAIRDALCLVLLEKGDLEAAIRMLDTVVAEGSTNGRAHFALALAYERKGCFAEALDHYRKAAADPAWGSDAILRAGVISCRQREFGEAIECFGQINPEAEASDTLLFFRGIALAHNSQVVEAIRDWNDLRARHPDNDRLSLNLARAHYLAGITKFKAGQLRDAVTSWTSYLEIYPNDDKVRRDLAQLYFRLATDELERGADVNRAANLLREAAKLNPADHGYAYFASLCELQSGQYEKCLGELRELMTAAGHQPRLLYHAAVCLLATEKWQEAASLIAELRASDAAGSYGSFGAWALANEHIRAGRTDEALELLSVAQIDLRDAA